MQNQNGAAQSKALIFVVALVVLIAGILLIGQDKSATNLVKDNHASALNSLKVAFSRANKVINERALDECASKGSNSIVLDSASIGIYNGFIASKREDIKNALGFVFNGKQSINPSTTNWQFQEMDNVEDGVAQVKIFDPSINKKDCYLLYSQAGNKPTNATPVSLIVNSGC